MGAPPPASRVVIGIDGSAGSAAALAYGLAEAELRRVPVLLVHAFSPVLLEHASRGVVDPALLRRYHRAAERARAMLARACACAHQARPRLEIETVAVNDHPGKALPRCCRHPDDVLVVGRTGAGGYAAVSVGSTTLSVSSRAAHAVLAVPSTRGYAAGGRVVAGVSPGGCSAVLRRAFAEATLRRAPLTVLGQSPTVDSVGSGGGAAAPPDGTAHDAPDVDSSIGALHRRHPRVRLRHETATGPAEHRLLFAAADSQLIVLGRQCDAAGPPLGALTNAVLHLAPCPVLVVPCESSCPGRYARQAAEARVPRPRRGEPVTQT